MDGQFIFEKVFNEGFNPDSRREHELMENLKDFIYFDKNSGLYKSRKGAEISETYDDITLTIKPVVNFIGLFSENNNYSPRLERKIKTPSVMLKFLGGEAFSESLLCGHKLGEVFNVTIDGYANSGSVEGFRAQLPSEISDLVYGKNKNVGFFATATSKNGRAGDIRFCNFTGVRPTMAKMRLGVDTSFGVIYDLDLLSNACKQKVLDKAGL